ncbi:hypothetical protein A2291_00280 [candidate division WOR-1 bacterium RIFOXYB2_FULL_42_35]|uniref:Bacterial surface antigen (D15) domain-containing protein n=1 Tax=candidate division WOR-1 bacterium RIFOXYC2_FULL_41_25 TaxID=1802586 RepID=A0A1F4TMB7_UNCSA|nr:MAG: hypothetical protein A2247_02935 [candidate division WOR-1 bacterium RIFOXYA2_FULL_41_14]OGC24149.1 MAG: hypothetical protein A2291_00280 [candidate division WOR-1 bacterium RIFOXYB2_FULL_42_35]OGC33836.1 MAG: hypothetical protein A2462_01955 [candidate division WOR-1 bacterium RIFOXYC2_FULL_41_25]
MKNKIVLLIVVFSAIFCSLSTPTQAKIKGKHFIYPVFAYSDTGYLIGGYHVYQPPSQRLLVENYLALGQKGLDVMTGLYGFALNDSTDLETNLSYSSFPQYYFGLGNNTPLNAKKEVYGSLINYQLGIRKELNPQWSWALFYLYSARQEDLAKNYNITYVSNEALSALEFSLRFDDRAKLNPTSGSYAHSFLTFYPGVANSSANLDDIWKLKLDLRYLKPFGENSLVLRSVLGTLSGGRASYLQMFKIGSDSLMRGIYSNRYVGKSLTAFQAEYRFKLFAIFSGACFIAAGQVGDTLGLSDLHYSKGVGLHILLPDGETPLRFDLASSEDTVLVYGSFGQAVSNHIRT